LNKRSTPADDAGNTKKSTSHPGYIGIAARVYLPPLQYFECNPVWIVLSHMWQGHVFMKLRRGAENPLFLPQPRRVLVNFVLYSAVTLHNFDNIIIG
jgi:hypothetical protein